MAVLAAGATTDEDRNVSAESTSQPAAVRQQDFAGPAPLRIAHALDMKPLDYIDHDYLSKGIFVDYWQLWSKKTGIPVTFEPAPYSVCIERVRSGQAAFLSGGCYTKEQDAYLDFSETFMEVKTSLFARGSLGAKGLADVGRQRIGVIRAGQAEQFLRECGPAIRLAVYDGSGELLRDAANGALDVFAMDYPSALYGLEQRGLSSEFEVVQTLAIGRVCAAVRKGNHSLLMQINRGIEQISEEEMAAIFDQWVPEPGLIPRWALKWLILACIATLLGGVSVHIILLRRRVSQRTNELVAANDSLEQEITVRKQAEKALAEQNVRLEEANRKLDHLARTDGLTGLLNRRTLIERLSDEVQRSRRYGTPLSIMLLDLDHFKQVNDTRGHLVGDAVLSRSAKAMVSAVREIDIVGRYGGEEFCVVLPETDIEGAAALAERVRNEVARIGHADANGKAFLVTCSIGVSSLNSDEGGETCLRRADEAMYAAKESGRNRIWVAGRQAAVAGVRDPSAGR
ncbi:MAG: diguanylate cyclase [Phycisphaerae bacterium]|nr:diguanylate cyclase [Phycisphaerae bacterium]